VGTILLPLILLLGSGGRIAYGWARPVPINPMVFRNPRQGVLLVSIAGPVSNVLLALAAGIVFRFTVLSPAMIQAFGPLHVVLLSIVSINLYLAFFNLIPIPPLDGSGVVSALLPVEYAAKYESMGRMGMLLIFALIILGSFMGFSVIGAVILPPAQGLFRLFTGL
jgi:Zn-dependent protease